jgi:hypothetical protein
VDAPKFNEPRIALNRIYTKGGDRVLKDATRIECYGTVDELSAFLVIGEVGGGAVAFLLLPGPLQRDR